MSQNRSIRLIKSRESIPSSAERLQEQARAASLLAEIMAACMRILPDRVDDARGLEYVLRCLALVAPEQCRRPATRQQLRCVYSQGFTVDLGEHDTRIFVSGQSVDIDTLSAVVGYIAANKGQPK